MLQTLSILASFATAIGAGLENFSFWWALIPTFFAGVLSLSNGPHYAAVIEANRQGNLWLFPTQLTIYWLGNLVGPAIAFGVTGWLAG